MPSKYYIEEHAIDRAKERLPSCHYMKNGEIIDYIKGEVENGIELSGQIRKECKAIQINEGVAILEGNKIVTVYDSDMYINNCQSKRRDWSNFN